MDKLRLRFNKIGKAKYISHLDLMASMRRALLRSGVDLWYSEGFNPHPYLSVAAPLSVGCASRCELMDIGTSGHVSPGKLPEILSAALPEGLEVVDAYLPGRKFDAVAWIEINGGLYYDSGVPAGAAEQLASLFNKDSIVISKKTKRGATEIDIAPHIRDIAVEGGETIGFTAKVSAKDPTITPENILSVFSGSHIAPGLALFTRMELYDEDMNIFR